ncbi:MAG: aspartate/glutamate racemase family protein [Bacillota bacterium]
MLGVIMLDTVFPRFPGDIGNKNTFDFPVKYLVVPGALPKRVVCEADRELVKPFIEAAKELERQGARVIGTSCGFLSLFQNAIAREVKVPFISSSLLQIPMVHGIFPFKKVGVLTAHASHLTREHFIEAGAGNTPVVVHGMEGMEEFSRVFVGNSPEADFEKLKREVEHVAGLFAGEDVGALVLECTNLPPFEKEIRRASGLPVFHLNRLINMVYHSV